MNSGVWTVGVLVVGASMLVITATCCSTESAELKAIRSDPISSLELHGTHRTELFTDSGQALGKPVQASLVLRFTPISGTDLRDVLEQAKDEAELAGWEMENEGVTLVSSKQVNGVTMELSMAINDYHDPAVVSVVLVVT